MEIKGVLDQLHIYNRTKIQDEKKDEVRSEEKATSPGEDKVVLSSRAKLLSGIIGKAKEASEVRKEKVEQLKAQIQEGTYLPNAEKIASKMMENEIDLFL